MPATMFFFMTPTKFWYHNNDINVPSTKQIVYLCEECCHTYHNVYHSKNRAINHTKH